MTTPTITRSLVNRLKYKHLLMLVTLSNCGNLHRAADALNMSQPATSRMLQDIEEVFGCALFERQARGMRPTSLGHELLRFARGALSSLERCAEDLAERQAGGYGYLSIGAIIGAVPELVVNAIATIKAQQPLLKLRLMGDTSDQLIEMLEQKRIDVAIARLDDRLSNSRFEFYPIGNEKLVAAVRRQHPLAQNPSPSIEELTKGWSWILQPETSPSRIALTKMFSDLGVNPPLDVIECSTVIAMLQLAQVTDTILALPDSLLRAYFDAGLLTKINIELNTEMSPFGAVLLKNEQATPEVESFLKLVLPSKSNSNRSQ